MTRISVPRLSDTEHTWRVAAKISGDYLYTDKTQIVSPIYGQRQAIGRSARQPVPARTRHPRSRFLQHSCWRRSGEFLATIGGNMTANEGNGGTEQPATEPEAPAVTDVFRGRPHEQEVPLRREVEPRLVPQGPQRQSQRTPESVSRLKGLRV